MVINAATATISQELKNMLEALFSSHETLHEVDKLKISRIRSLIEKLQAVDRIDADKAAADFETFFLNYEGAMRAIRNIEALGARDEAIINAFRIEANFLNATRALSLSKKAISSPGNANLGRVFFSCLSIGAFQTVVDAVESANKEQRVIMNEGCIAISRRAASVLDRLGVSQEEVAACIDVAGSMIQERKMLWLNQAPDIYVVGDGGGDLGIAMEFRLPISASQASDMTWEWCEKLTEADLYKAGVTFGFVGVR